ncbi:recBCD enzyme subunit RecB, P-loop containing nucleoside triphosphate hydrolase [Artemisia annua]|uniref:RecBCD enzyme subunit RecB, P-loop containing nucleoside triphosphate hydrolase n=1 Tax=Artemisia annua TaxID=35608 RepID=A0A2U1Q206_ARTAN|nr:recBCD enzyme subunit RecB, P-loop containing nucleoside triphosphate hydrolase [Artemisia annua]
MPQILFSDDFRRSFGKLTSDRVKKLVLNLLLRLSNGWCPKRSLGLPHENSTQSLKQFNVEGLYIISTIDIIKDINYVQVIKVWDILPFEEIPKLTKQLENIYSAYTGDYISRCTEKLFERNLVVPRCWEASQEIIRFRHLVNDEGDGRSYVENSKVSESLLLMKFYSFSYEVVCHLLSDNAVDLPMQLTDDQMDVLLFRKSSFITGSISSNGNSLAEIGLDADNVTSEFSDIPDTFIDIPRNMYPLVITFHNFLMMLDGTLGNSFFERFLEARESSHGSSEGNLSHEGYYLLAESRSSTLSKEKREIFYTLFETYEKMKSKNGDFDLGDFVNDIHKRLKNEIYEGDQMNFVYIDEVSRYTILSTAISRKQGKGFVSEIKQLKQNFRTHAGVLELAQSVIDILYCYFVNSIDNLEPETSLISGEAPVLLESCNDENAVVTIFGGCRSGGEIVGFGAEQVILVRDDRVKLKFLDILEDKLLFSLYRNDVLLYNFFGTSPLKDQWRVIYDHEYMKKHVWLDEELPQSFPTFNEARHGVLCSELKQLYVAITRTTQRL